MKKSPNFFWNFLRAACSLDQAASNTPHFHEVSPNSFGDKNSSGSWPRTKPGQPYSSTVPVQHITHSIRCIQLYNTAVSMYDPCMIWILVCRIKVYSCIQKSLLRQTNSTVSLCNSKLCEFDSLYIGKYCTFVCGTLTYDGLENIENRSRALEVKLQSVPYSVFLMFGFCMGDPHTNLK
jgi:hypothetical protein